MPLKNDRYTYRVTWSAEDEEHVGHCTVVDQGYQRCQRHAQTKQEQISSHLTHLFSRTLS